MAKPLKPTPKGAKSGSKAAPPITSVSVTSGRGPRSTERTVRVEKISNGFLVSECTYGPKGYSETKRYEPKAPVLKVDGPKK